MGKSNSSYTGGKKLRTYFEDITGYADGLNGECTRKRGITDDAHVLSQQLENGDVKH